MAEDNAALRPLSPSPPRATAAQRMRTYFLTGLIVAGPLAITAYITWSFITLVDGWVKVVFPTAYRPDANLPFEIPGFGLVVAVFGLTLLGFLTANLVGRSMLDLSEMLLGRMPVVRGLYKSVKQVFQTVFSESGSSFRKVGLVEFPGKGMWSIVFISTPPTAVIDRDLPPSTDGYVSCFLPCTPNPTTGFYFYLPRRDVIEIGITVDEAAKLVMSAGLIQPEDRQSQLAALASEALAEREQVAR
jgi:uncharacterized membrane protein